jgi:hypothetical protein
MSDGACSMLDIAASEDTPALSAGFKTTLGSSCLLIGLEVHLDRIAQGLGVFLDRGTARRIVGIDTFQPRNVALPGAEQVSHLLLSHRSRLVLFDKLAQDSL